MASQVEPCEVSAGTHVPPASLDTISVSVSLPPLRDGKRTGQGRASYGQVTGPLPPRGAADAWSQASTLLLFLKKNHRAEAHLLGFPGAEAKKKIKNAAEEQTHGKRGREAGGRRYAQAVASREGLASASGYLRGGPTRGEACPCQECPHFIYSPSLT